MSNTSWINLTDLIMWIMDEWRAGNYPRAKKLCAVFERIALAAGLSQIRTNEILFNLHTNLKLEKFDKVISVLGRN